MKPLKVKCPAKLNLFLDISFRMPNGYHIMEMVMQSVNLFDTLYLTLDSSGEIEVAMENSLIPGDQKNIAYRCAQALLEAAGSSQGVHIRIHKEIPAQAGLGGGSADGAGVLVGLNHLLGSPLNLQQLCDLGAAIGSDIPFCIIGGTAVVRGFGEIIEPIQPLAPCNLLIAKPAVGMDTAECFRRYDALGRAFSLPGIPAMKAAIQAGDVPAVCSQLYNALEEAAALPEVEEIRQIMLDYGAMGSRMTGSGSAVFGVFHRAAEQERCARRLKQLGHTTRRCSPVNYGAKIVV